MATLKEGKNYSDVYVLSNSGPLKTQFHNSTNVVYVAPIVKNRIVRYIKTIIELFRIIKSEKYDFIQFYHYSTAARYLLLLNFFSKTKISYFIGSQGHNKSTLQKIYIKAMINHIDLIIVNSYSICDSFNIRKDTKNIFLLKNILDSSLIDSINNQNKNIKDIKNIGIVGRLDPIKRHDIFLKIAKYFIDNN